MKSAFRVAAGSLLLTGALTFAGAGDVSAQATAGPPVSVSGWRYEKGQSDLHLFHCEQPKCGTNSKVSYKILAPGNPMTLEQYREEIIPQFRGVAGGKLNVGVISAGDYFFPSLLVEFVRRHRDVNLNFTVHNREGLLAHLGANLTDLASSGHP